MMRNKMASQATNNESYNTQRHQAPQSSLEANTSDKIIGLDSLSKNSSKFSSPTKSNGKPRPGLLTTTI
jgi:hypothetical protein